jgi:hypothetical protein
MWSRDQGDMFIKCQNQKSQINSWYLRNLTLFFLYSEIEGVAFLRVRKCSTNYNVTFSELNLVTHL